MKLGRQENELIGDWISTEQGVVGDDVTLRIEDLIENHLRHVATDATGWDRLYLDPDDFRLWELTYPSSGRHGGGPPQLTVVSGEYAEQKYGWTFPQSDPNV